MDCKDVLSCFGEINAYCRGESTGYPLLVNTENYDIYQDILGQIQADSSKKCVYISEYCRKDELPDLYEICRKETKKENHVLVGVSQVAMLRSADYVNELLRDLLELPISGHAIILLDHSRQYLKSYINRDQRVGRKVVIVEGESSPLPKIKMAKCLEDCVIIDDSRLQKNMKHLFQYFEGMNNKTLRDNPEVTVITDQPISLFCKSVYSIAAIDNIYDALIKKYRDLAAATEKNFGSEEQWRILANRMKKQHTFSAVVHKVFGSTVNLVSHLSEAAEEPDENKMWYLWLALKVYGNKGNLYLTKVLENSQSVLDFERHIYMDILEMDWREEEFKQKYYERKRLIDAFPENIILVDQYCKAVGIREKNAVYYLTDASEKEQYELMRCLSIYEYTNQELEDIFSLAFAELKLYLHKYEFTESNMKLREKDKELWGILTEYFSQYKLQKLTNRIWPEFLSQVESFALERLYNKLQPRSTIVNRLPKENIQVYFFDALGVEYLAYIEAKCQEYGLVSETQIGSCMLPSITENNKEFVPYFSQECLKIGELDELKHHSQVIDYQKCKLPIHIFKELDIIDDQLRRIQAQLTREPEQRAILIADHGASRLAVIKEQEADTKLSLDEKAGHSGRCCLANKDPDIPFAAFENGYSILANYDRFRGGRKANVEVHGGATLEEVVVPVIVISKRPDDIMLCFTNPLVELHAKETAAITLFSNIPIQKPRLLVNGKFYEGEHSGDLYHAKFVMPELKRSKTWNADIYEGDKRIGSNLSFRVQKVTGQEVDLI